MSRAPLSTGGESIISPGLLPLLMSGIAGRHVVHIGDFSKDEILSILDAAERMVPHARTGLRIAEGRVLGALFFEPSTRTRLSFEAAMARLGGVSLGFAEPGVSSVAKGETLADTVRTASQYSDVLVLRHPQEGAARLASKFSSVPVINGGDGAGQHPTQTLLDLFTVRRERGPIEKQRVALIGDLKYGRTVHSLAQALATFGAEMAFVAPPTLQMPRDAQDRLKESGARFTLESNLDKVIGTLDVLYVTRIQRERFPDPEEYARVAGSYRIDAELLSNAKKGAIVLHPLPRVGEISTDVDTTPHAKYFEQAFYGVPVRMGLLAMVMGLKA